MKEHLILQTQKSLKKNFQRLDNLISDELNDC